eukprot:4990795-Pleurochrysis_carterae.AAC.4
MTISTNTDSYWSGSRRRLAQARGLGAPTGRLKEGGAHWARVVIASGLQEPGERSASAPQVCMRYNYKTAKRACACRLRMKGARDYSL